MCNKPVVKFLVEKVLILLDGCAVALSAKEKHCPLIYSANPHRITQPFKPTDFNGFRNGIILHCLTYKLGTAAFRTSSREVLDWEM